jgi:hypothetical protein
MRPIDQSFDFPRTPVGVVGWASGAGEAQLTRALLESLGAVVTLHQPGTPSDFLRVLGQGDSAGSALVICAHGDANGFVFGDYAPGIDTSCLINGSMPAQAIAGNVRLPGRIVVSTACGTGSAAFAKAFTEGGLSAYIAPSHEPEGADVPLFLHLLFHQLLRRGAHVEAAFAHARGYDEQGAMFVLHRPGALLGQ